MEHQGFLRGLEVYGYGNCDAIGIFVPSRSPLQIEAYAQWHFAEGEAVRHLPQVGAQGTSPARRERALLHQAQLLLCFEIGDSPAILHSVAIVPCLPNVVLRYPDSVESVSVESPRRNLAVGCRRTLYWPRRPPPTRGFIYSVPTFFMVYFVLASVSTLEICGGEEVLFMSSRKKMSISCGKQSCRYKTAFGRSSRLDTFCAQDR